MNSEEKEILTSNLVRMGFWKEVYVAAINRPESSKSTFVKNSTEITSLAKDIADTALAHYDAKIKPIINKIEDKERIEAEMQEEIDTLEDSRRG